MLQFRKASITELTWPVKYREPIGEGRYKQQEFLATFKRKKQSDLKRYSDQLSDGSLTDDDLIDDVLLGWSQIKDEQGDEFPYSESNKKILFEEFPGMKAAVLVAFFDSIGGVLRKN